MAAIGIEKSKRDFLGRWSPGGSDDYVRTYRAAVRDLIGRFVSTVKAGRAFTTFDEEEVAAELTKRLIEKGTDTDAATFLVGEFAARASASACPTSWRPSSMPNLCARERR